MQELLIYFLYNFLFGCYWLSAKVCILSNNVAEYFLTKMRLVEENYPC